MRALLPGVLLGAALLLGGGIVYEAVAPLDPIMVETPQLKRRAAIPLPSTYIAPSPDLFADIDARPLFSAQRKPLAGAQAGAAAANTDFVLVGVIMGSERAVALLRNKNTQATVSAAVGDLVNGWRVARIDATTVTLRSATGDFVVPLDGPANRPPSAALQPVEATPTPAPIQAPSPMPSAPAAPLATPQRPATAPPSNVAIAPAKPGLPAHTGGGTIAPEALRGAPRDPTTGEPTL